MGLNCPEDMAAQAGLLELPTTGLVEMMRSLRLEDVPKVRSVCRQLRDMQLSMYMPMLLSANYSERGLYGLLVCKYCASCANCASCAASSVPWPSEILPHLIKAGAPVERQLNIQISVTVVSVRHVLLKPFGSPTQGTVWACETYRVRSEVVRISEFEKFASMMIWYCKKLGLDPNASEFLFEGVVLDGLQCPYDVDMDSNVTVHVLPSGLYTRLLQDGIPGRDELDPEILITATHPETVGAAIATTEVDHPATTARMVLRAQIKFKIRKTTAMRKLMDAFFKRLAFYAEPGLDRSMIVFTFDGKRIHGEQCAYDHGMTNESHIDIMPANEFVEAANKVHASTMYILAHWNAVGMPFLQRQQMWGGKNISPTLRTMRLQLDTLCARWHQATPIIIAAAYGRSETVAELLCAHADEDATDKENNTALDVAREFQHTETYMTLM